VIRARACLLFALPLAFAVAPAHASTGDASARTESVVVTEAAPDRPRTFRTTSRRDMEATGARLAAGARRQISGPALTYQADTDGPTIELASLGGKVDGAPRLLHLAFEWKF
jgi:hypothetical protein